MGIFVGCKAHFIDFFYSTEEFPQSSPVWLHSSMKYVFAIMNDETRFWLAQEVANTKFTHDARSVFRMGKERMGKERAGKTPKTR